MQVLSNSVMRGPNYWCPNRHKLIVLSIALQASEFLSREQADVISARMGSLFSYRRRNIELNFLIDLTGQIALELQTMAGIDCAYYKIHNTCNPHRFYLVYSYEEEQSGLYAADIALRLAEAISRGEISDIEGDLQKLKQLHRRAQLGPSTRSIVEEAIKRGIPVRRLDRHSLIMLGGTKKILSGNYISVPKGVVVSDKSALLACLKELDFPLVVKPLAATRGAILEVNAGPGLRMHLAPTVGRARNELKKYASNVKASRKTGIIACRGDDLIRWTSICDLIILKITIVFRLKGTPSY